MYTIDPQSPRKVGIDLSGQIVRLGETDSDGYFVGYITEDGTPWQDRRDRDLTVGVNVAFDAFLAWNYHGGLLSGPPDLAEILAKHDVPLNLMPWIAHEANDWIFTIYAASSEDRAVAAAWN